LIGFRFLVGRVDATLDIKLPYTCRLNCVSIKALELKPYAVLKSILCIQIPIMFVE
jgi:hypothetical protein